jgi:hypothetical protein
LVQSCPARVFIQGNTASVTPLKFIFILTKRCTGLRFSVALLGSGVMTGESAPARCTCTICLLATERVQILRLQGYSRQIL